MTKLDKLERDVNVAGQYFSSERFDKVLKIILAEYGARE